jgi:chromosome segregation ATPase
VAAAQAELGAARARLTALDAAIAQTPREITLFTEPDAQRRLRDLELERDALLARYTPESQTVRAADERLARARALLTQPEAAASALNRAGPNPAWQDLMLERARAAAQAKAQEARLAAIRTSLAENQRGLVQLQSLRAMHEALMRQRATLDAAARAIAGRIETQQSKADAIVPIESASPQGSALSLPAAHVWGLGGLSALLAAALGLARAAGRRGFSTAAAAERAVGLPVLAAVR